MAEKSNILIKLLNEHYRRYGIYYNFAVPTSSETEYLCENWPIHILCQTNAYLMTSSDFLRYKYT